MHRLLRFTRQLRTAKVDEVWLLKECEEAGGAWLARTYSKLPAEYENFYKGVQQPIRYDVPLKMSRIQATMQNTVVPSIQERPSVRRDLCPDQKTSAKS